LASYVKHSIAENPVVFDYVTMPKMKDQYNIIGNSKAIGKIFLLIEKVAKRNVTVLITGESGVGKEMVAQAIHANSKRSDQPLIQMNCAAVHESLVESELFGHKRGSFTGAYADRDGKFIQSHKGILFLDEIADLSLSAQAKILRTIESGEVEVVGGEELENVDVRILSATNQNLSELVARGLFREDLFHRLNVIEIHIPPLRERPEDILPLAYHYLERFCLESDIQGKILAPSAIAVLLSYNWPGNVRELKNIMQKVTVLVDSQVVNSNHIKGFLRFSQTVNELNRKGTFRKAINVFEKCFIVYSLWENDWNISRTAHALGLPRSSLYDKLNKYQIQKCPESRMQCLF